MKKYLLFVILSLLCFDTAFSQDSTQTKKEEEWKMRTYYMVFLKSNPNHGITDKEKLTEIQKGHLDNIGRLFEEGKLVLAGPFLDKQDVRGIFILKVDSEEEAKALVDTDPAVIAGTLTMEIRPWYGPNTIIIKNE
ncbi:MAG TPA: YciI family protein [Ignavibacteria bacterium]|nr:YciI family protein [Ignavibacteria bacterium]